MAWTATSPVPLKPQTETMLSNSIFKYVNDTRSFNFADGSGSYTFLFGVAYNQNTTIGQPFIVDVYASLVSETISSAFLRGVALHLQQATILVDGATENGINVRSTYSPQVASFYLSFTQINATSGTHTLTIRLILNTIDVYYIGYFTGSTQVAELNETITAV